jgi:hypothetical protein
MSGDQSKKENLNRKDAKDAKNRKSERHSMNLNDHFAF